MSSRKARKKPQQARSAATVEAIVEAAGQVLGRLGFRRASTTKVAERAGVSVGSLYQYFPGKEAVITAFLKRRIEQDVSIFVSLVKEGEGRSLEELMRIGAREVVRVYREDRELYRRTFSSVPGLEQIPEVREALRDAAALGASYLYTRRDELGGRDPELVAQTIFFGVRGALNAIVVDTPERLDDPDLPEMIGDLGVALAGLDPDG